VPRSGRSGRQLSSFLFRASANDEVNADIAFHLDMTVRELINSGLTEQQARAEAERRFGNVAAVSAECREYANQRDHDDRRAELRTELRQDVTFGARQLLRAPLFSLIAILTLAVGFGATAAMFSAFYSVVLRPLPFDHPDRVVRLVNTRQGEEMGASAPDFLAIRAQSRGAFDAVAASVPGSGFTVMLNGEPELIGGGRVSADFFSVFGVSPAMGRTFSDDEDLAGRDNVVVLSHRAWVNRFNSDRGVVGRPLQVDGRPRTIIGVMPAKFDLTSDSDELWVPLALSSSQATKFGERYLQLHGRLRDGVSLAQATAVAITARRTAVTIDPDRRLPIDAYAVSLRRYQDEFVGDYGALLRILLGAVGFVLLIACTNVANLLIARGTTRARELSIRAALGAGRGRLVRQLLTESVVLSLVAAILGVGLAYGLLGAVLGVSPDNVPRLDQARVDWRVLMFTLGVALVATFVFGLLPALRTAGAQLERALREGGRAVRGARDHIRSLLVGVEVALAMALLVGAALLIRSAWLVQRVDPGFDPRGVLTSRLLLPAAQYSSATEITTFYERLHQRVNEEPAVQSAALVSVVPLSANSMNASVLSEEQSRDEARPTDANFRVTSSKYFATMRIPIVAGRDINERDVSGSPLVVIINEALAARLWPQRLARDVVGKRINALGASRATPHFMEIVGVVGNLKDEALSRPVRPEFYVPVAQTPPVLWPFLQRSLVLAMRARGSGSAETLARPMRAAVTAVDPGLPVADIRSMESYLRSSQGTARFNTLLLSTLGGIALLLAMVGVYGVVSYFVSQRSQEIAIRVALGATPGAILGHVVWRGLRPLLGGLVVGCVLAIVTSRVLESQLYRVQPTDPATIGGTAVVLLLVAALATYVPARRALRVAPASALTE
jgi:putative ABC transport system permease protein